MTKHLFDEKTYNANITALKRIVMRGNRLVEIWHKAIKTPLTKEHVNRWIDDPQYIWQVYRKENEIPEAIWPAMPKTELPRLDEPRSGMGNVWMNVLQNIKEKPYRHARDISIFVDLDWVEWQNGQPIIPETVETKIKERCMFRPNEKTAPKIKAVFDYVNIRNKTIEIFGKNIPIREMANGRVEADVTKLRMLNMKNQ